MQILETLAYCRERAVELKLDGGRLRLIGSKDAVDDRLLEMVRANKADLIELLQSSQQDKAQAAVEIVAEPERAALQPCSYNQQRLWFLQQLAVQRGENQGAYNGGSALELHGQLNHDALAAALRELVARHESLRTAFVEVDGTPWQQVRPVIELQYDTLRCDAGDALEQAMQQAVARPFDLAADTLIRATLYSVSAEHHVLLLVTHHITSDAWSQEILLRDFCLFYNAHADQVAPALAPPTCQYLDYARWERSHLQGARLDSKLARWQDYLADAPRLHALPVDMPREIGKPSQAGRLEYCLDDGLVSQLGALAQAEQTTLFTVLAAAYSVLLHKLGNEADVVFGMPVANRTRAEFEATSGYFSNTVVLRNRLPQDYSLRQAVALTKANVGFVLSQQDVPFDMLVDELKVARDPAYSPLYQLWFSMHEGRRTSLELTGLETRLRPITRQQGRYDLKLEVELQDLQLHLNWEYDKGLFEGDSITRFQRHFAQLLRYMVSAPDTALSALTLEGSELVSGAAAEVTLLPVRWAQSLALRAGHPAVVAADTCLSFAQVELRVDRLAALLTELGVARGDRVGVCTDSAVEALIATLACWRLAAVCVPIDAASPTDALEAALATAAPAWVLTTPAGAEIHALRKLELVLLQGVASEGWLAEYADATPSAAALAADDLACLLPAANGYAVVSHGNLAHDLLALEARGGFAPGMHFGGGSAVEAGTAMQLALACAGTLHQLPTDAAELAGYVRAQAIDVVAVGTEQLACWRADGIEVTPAHGLIVTEYHDPVNLEPALLRGTPAGCRVIARYGQPETGLSGLFYSTGEKDGLSAGGGRPGSVQAWILQGQQAAPLGAWGELVLAGPSVAQGYAHAGAGADRFFRLAVQTDAPQAYRTGLRARMDIDGEVVCGGRFDECTIKNGLRIDPAVTVAALRRLPAVKAAAVTFYADMGVAGELVAHVMSNANPDALLQQLKQSLPQHQIPRLIVPVTSWPQTHDGRLDRAALPAPADLQGGVAVPASETEQMLQAIWAELLGRPSIGRQDDFFGLGGHSLLATRMLNRVRGRIWPGLALPAIFAHPVLADLARHIEQGRARDALQGGLQAPIPSRMGAAPARLSHAQEQLWLIDRIEQGSAHYNMLAAYRLEGSLDQAALTDALVQLVSRHAALRTRFAEVDGEVRQFTDHAWHLPVQREDYRGLTDVDREAAVAAWMEAELRHQFDLAGGMLLRASVLLLEQDVAQLVLNIHHTACDGWSIELLMQELQVLYAAAPDSVALAPLAIEYSDYAEWQRAQQQGDGLAQQAAFWREELAGAAPLHGLALDKKRPQVLDHQGGALVARLDTDKLHALKQLARSADTTLFGCLESLFALFIARLSGSDDVVIGTAVSGRSHGDTEPLVGLFANMLPLRHQIDRDMPVQAYLAQAHQRLTRALDHQHYPFELLVNMLNPDRSLAYHPVFQLAFGLKQAETKRMTLPGLSVSQVARTQADAKFDLMLSAVESADGLSLEWLYATCLFEPATIAGMAAQFNTMLVALLTNPALAVGKLPLLAEQDHAFLAQHARGGDAAAFVANLYECFSDMAAAQPGAAALVDEHGTMRYDELAIAAERQACRLAGRGVTEGDRVMLHLPRGRELIVCLLAISRLGAAYVPVDASYPEARLRQIADDCGAALAISTEPMLPMLAALGIPSLSVAALAESVMAALPMLPVDPARLGYIMYTSGSTGTPKGVAVPQGAIHRLVCGNHYMQLDRTTTMLQLASVAFDASTLEIWGPLLNGGSLAIYSEPALDLAQLTDFLARHGVTSMWLTAALFDQWTHHLDQPLPQLRQVLAGGDVVSPAAVGRLYAKLAQVSVINGYGPTENTTFTCCHTVERNSLGDRPLPIGRPIAGTHVRVVDAAGQLLPVGAIGELQAGGAGLALGYWGNATLTATQFTQDGQTGETFYRTGDLVRWRADGVLEYLGRLDTQVKLRGYRIELAEVERCLLAQDGVMEACVIVREEGERQLVAYYTATADGQADVAALTAMLRRALQAELPRFMVPAAIVALPHMPVTVNGKLDRRALPMPQASDYAAARFVAAETPLEQCLAELWAELLRLDQVGVEDDFFALGGNSLLATRMASLLAEKTGYRMPIRDLFQYGTIRALARWLGSCEPTGELQAVQTVPRTEAMTASYAQQRLWFIDRMEGGSSQYNMPALFDLHGELDLPLLQQALQALVERHEILRTCYREVEGEATQLILPASARIAYHDLCELPSPQRPARAEAILLADAKADFDLAQGPVFRTTLVRLDEHSYRMLFNMHHIASDGWSVGVLMRDLAALYRAACEGEVCELPPLAVQYADYAAWQREQLSSQRRDELLVYWREQLRDLPPLHGLPLDKARPARLGTQGAAIRTRAAPALAARLNALAQAHGVSLFMLLQASYALLLSRVSGESEIVVGTPIAGRDRREFEALVGCFVNTLVLRNRIPQRDSFAHYLASCRGMVLDAFDHQQLPFDMLVEDINPVRSASHLPLFQLWFVLQNMDVGQLALPGLSIEEVLREEVAAKFDLMLSATERDGAIEFNWVYNSELFEQATLQSWADSFGLLLEAIVRDPGVDIGLLPLVTEAQQRQLAGYGEPIELTLPDTTVLTQFLHQAHIAPARLAVRHGDSVLSYGELAERADRLAGYLVELGVLPGDRIGICCGRSVEQLIAVLGIWQAGACFVPLDPQAPQARLAMMVEDAGANWVLAFARTADLFDLSMVDVVLLDGAGEDAQWMAEFSGNPDKSRNDGLAYVIYTSGTTGRPKGVMVEHGSLGSLGAGLDAVLAGNGIDTPLRWAWNAPLVFDAALQAVSQLAVGSELHILPEAVRTEPSQLLDYLLQHDIGLLDCTPSLLDLVLQEAKQRGCALPHLLVGGEAIHDAQWQEIAQWMAKSGRVALNVYGPTETTVDATWARIDPDSRSVIGCPLPNVRVQVLDARLQPVPPGAVGECCIAGPGVARGYLNQAALEQERFIELATAGGAGRYYRSGDLVRWLPDGKLAYLGRRDTQVKLRGYRIELGEIEQVLREYPAVADAAVIVSSSTETLLAYVVAHGQPVLPEALAAHCRGRLPEYMVPSVFVDLPGLPLNRNGKLDIKALPAPQVPAESLVRQPVSATEQALAAIWARILKRTEVTLDGNFFALGGHSLLAIRIISAIREILGVELPLAAFFAAPTIAQLAVVVDGLERRRALPAIKPVADRQHAPLSHAQHRLWLIDRLEGGSPQYNMPAAFELYGRFDEQACRRSLALIMSRHEILRTCYVMLDGQPVQYIQAEPSLPFSVTDLSAMAALEQADAVAALLQDDAHQPFDLSADTMLRVQLLRLSAERHVLAFNMHHIASDGWSISLLINEFVEAYRAYVEGGQAMLAPLPIQYGDYAHWQRQVLDDGVLAPQLSYWSQQLAALPQVHSLPLDKPRPIRQTYRGSVLTRRVPAELLGALRQLSIRSEATLFMTLQAALAALVSRWSNEQDVVIGTPAAGRGEQQLEKLIGFFLNTLVLRSNLAGNPSFDTLLGQTKANVLAAFEHQDVPFEMLVELLKPERSLSHPALFQIMFVLQNQEQSSFALPGLDMRAAERQQVLAKFDLLLNANECGDGLDLTWNYNADLFDAATIERMADGYEQILHAVVADSRTRLQALNLLPAAEADKIVRQWNDTALDLPYEQTLQDLFVAQVRRTPEAVAAIDEHGQLSYAELFAQAAALAQALRTHVVQPEALVAVLLPKGRLQLVATLGIMMAGAAYLPLDTAWPGARLDQVMSHGGACALVTLPDLAAEVQLALVQIDLASLPALSSEQTRQALSCFASPQSPADLAYVIFTSGSTGKPKGVAIAHRSAVNTILDINQRYGVGYGDAVLAVSALSFDLSVYDMFGLLAVGGRVVFPDDARQKDPQHWAELVERHRISLWDSVPASAELLTAQYEWRQQQGGGALRTLMMSGDWIPPTLPARIAKVFPGVDIHSLGGATEGSIWSISYPIREDMSDRKSVPYGKPLANQAFYVLTDDLVPCPVGVVGELHIGGIGVAREYYGDAERTAASYVTHPGLNDRLYKTGDIGRYLPDGNIEFVGRKDLQVKLRGFRIELGEIEAALSRHEQVADAVVMVLKDHTGVQQLVAYICLEEKAGVVDWAQQLRGYLAALVPNYMVPAYYVLLDAFPLSANNKVDRKQLPIPDWEQADSSYCEPEGDLESLLAGIWQQVLGRERIGADRNFFELGGSSVHLIEIASKANLMLQQEINVVSYFEHPTIRAMAAFINARQQAPAPVGDTPKRAKGRLADRLAKRGTA
ncbi:amino acid adenylation domain-containing protein [Chitinimonas viridis]|uniref:Amino acid adenylation domain-containing protein n=1 Tax=Chitinimonas viridis TaxID=664880 RepID=A0ABT8B858_9NEIS|nr:non-ribosomal peptide synthetase [Chitinimonas viridis]MDN3578328.1 amino acid adenylation domain-containing protein [Chitinimonas viridis]